MNATHLKIGRKLCRKSNGVGNGINYMVRRDTNRRARLLRDNQEETANLLFERAVHWI